MAALSRDALLRSLHYHTVLPRNVPGREDKNLYETESELAERLTNATKSLALHAPLDDHHCLDAIRLALSTCKSLHVEGKIDKNLLLNELRQLGGKQALILHVTEQNAALLIYPQISADGTRLVVFEAFETSATCEMVLATEDALQWDFPGQAVAVPYDTFGREDFQQGLSTFLEQASLESIKQFAAITYKACAPLPEIRNTSDPALVTGALMTMLEVNGTLHDTPLLRKRIRDTVSFDKAHKPWRRSAFYLVLRVAVQRHLYTLFGVDKGRFYYKVTMCILLSKLLDDGLYHSSNEASHYLRQKLGRRLAKLEVDQERGSKEIKSLHRQVFRTLGRAMEKSLSSAARLIESEWDSYKRKTSRIVRPIQHVASPFDLALRLPLSSPALNRAMHLRFSTAQTEIRSPSELLGHYESNTTLKPFNAVSIKYLSLFTYESQISEAIKYADDRSETAGCIHLARNIESYLSTILNAYTDYAEFKSRQLLKVMELWVLMDRYALQCFPLLAKYHPGFHASMLDVLELSTFEELTRLQAVQSYIAERCQGWCGNGSRTIFDSPADDSFAVCYYDESTDSAELQELRKKIEQEADESLALKKLEWQRKSQKHESKIQEMAGLSCVYITEVDEHGLSKLVHKKPCRKHKLKWEAGQIKIDIFEYPLPKADHALKALIFELKCPRAFASYRDATWLILSTFAYASTTTIGEVPLLRAYSGLATYANNTKTKVTLGSSTKSHLKSHYSESGFPVSFRDVCRSFGMKLDYFDNEAKTWTLMEGQASFTHLFPLKLPPNSPYLPFETINASWPTSNKILATQTKCPTDLNVHEYIAWQGLMLGTHSRWPCLLRELGSTNMSFSTDSTWAIVTRVIAQAGPATSDDVARDAHAVFHDRNFCRKLLDQVDYRLEAIRRNWREPVQLDILLSMLLKINTLTASAKVRTVVAELLAKSRSITQSWCTSLHFADQEQGSGLFVFATWAAVLCKRTFYPIFENDTIISCQLVKEFVVASIALQNCLVGKFDTLPQNLRIAVLRDLHLAFHNRHHIQLALRSEDQPLVAALQAFWSIPQECMDSPITMYTDPNSWWVSITIPSKYTVQHVIHYNFVQGTLLIDGQELGTLPPEYRRWPIIEELFGAQALNIYPSALPGMSLLISRQMPFDHRVHLGFRDNSLVIRAEHHGTIMELIPRSLFGNERQYDLPSQLVYNCYHWLDLNRGVMEVRQQDPWKSRRSNWVLNLRTQQATRNSGFTLIDPNSDLAIKVAQNFYQFEYAHNITVFYTPRGEVRVELKRLELDFVVTKTGLLKCPQLGAVIAESRLQDIGTWHGLRSKLVVRSVQDPTQRSVLVPMGEAIYEREGPHLSVVIKNAGSYLKFGINDVLGRIDCPAEPVMLYHRALWHASTAYFLPDALTNRTGVEEAMQYLRSGAYQPWTPLSSSACTPLLTMAGFSPQRTYYPVTLKAMESVHWNPVLTSYIQDDRYRRAVEDILKRNAELSQFALIVTTTNDLPHVTGDLHLENRALSRGIPNHIKHDQTYKPRDRRIDGPRRSNVATVAELICDWPSELANTTQLASLLQKMPIIGGYVRGFDKVQFTDILEAGRNLGVDWGALVNTTLGCSKDERFRLVFLFSVLAFSAEANVDLLRSIISFALITDLKRVSFPKAAAYNHFQSNEVFQINALIRLVEGAKQPYMANLSTPPEQLLWLQYDHEKKTTKASRVLAESIHAQWPSKELNLDQLAMIDRKLLDQDEALLYVLPEWSRLVDNYQFSQHIEVVQLMLNRHAAETRPPSLHVSPDRDRSHTYPLRMMGGELPSLADILEKDLSALAPPPQTHHTYNPFAPSVFVTLPNGHTSGLQSTSNAQRQFTKETSTHLPLAKHIKELSKLVLPHKLSPSMIHKRYGNELDDSIKALSEHLAKPAAAHGPFNPAKLSSELFDAREIYRTSLNQIRGALQKGDARARWLNSVGLWPKVTISTLLTELRSTSKVSFGPGVKEALVRLGLMVTSYQRLLRIQEAVHKDRRQQMFDERENIGHTNWSPLDRVDWLLLEIDSNIMIRPEQVDVALATISPDSGQNSVVQLLMGKGKTSCILPMVALTLASENMFRIIVPRPLLLQSAQIMQAKLGGLLDREVVHVPFSRKTPTDKALMQTYCQLHSHIHKQSGIVLALPEHVLSFKLSGLQRLCDGRLEEAALMIKAQAWLDRKARDVLDECDVSLAIRTQLIYPSGSQQTVDGHPLRWQTVQALLDLVVSYLPALVREFPSSIEIVNRTGFPLIYFLRKDVEDYLITQIVQKICAGQTVIISMHELPHSCLEDIRDFISVPLIGAEITARIIELFKEQRHLMDVLYHLRGLFVHRILLSTFKKRWNVQYGLHPTRDPIAVPYQAKGVPSPTAEWGHPDVAIILTCLSFYYEGLSLAQFKQAFEQLAKSNEPSIEYSLWVAEGVPEGLKNYNAVNVEDSQQLRELHYYTRFKVCLLDFYLNSFVFPQHAKQFSKKLSASGSDLILYEPARPACSTTGFSGTNDTRHQLPMTIRQSDLPQLAHTNAEVLAYLLEDRNRSYIRMVDIYNKRLSEDGLLKKLLYPGSRSDPQPRIRILIDAGAQILEYSNRSLASAWLKVDPDAPAAVYFGEDHRARVLYGKGTDMPLVASPFAENLDNCLVYIDESHCRGTDLKLPPNARAAVTLGPHLTKDALAQAAMRLRLLGKTQSIAFFSPPEVHQSILDLRTAARASPLVPLSSVDVIRWLLEQTCNGIEQLEPLYFNQGLNYLQRMQAKLDHEDVLDSDESRNAYLDIVRTKELHSLKQSYEPKHQQRGPAIKVTDFAPSLRPFVSEVLQRRKCFQDRGFAVHSSALEEVEQEREMEFEVESVREVQSPVHFKALRVARLHYDIKEFAKSGRLPAGSDAFEPVFCSLQKTALGVKHGTITAVNTTAKLYVSTQFNRTVSINEPNDNFLRPCHWLLWSCASEVGLLVSPEEADALIPILRHTFIDNEPACHMIVYAAPITRRMLQFNNMDYYTIPSLPTGYRAPKWLKVELGIFAGRLYFDWDEYEEIMSYLGIQLHNNNDELDLQTVPKEAFATKPLAFLHEWLAIRRKGQDFEHTPKGFITTGKPLSKDHPFFASVEDKADDSKAHPVARLTKADDDTDDDSDDDDDNAKDQLFARDDGDNHEVFHDADEEFDDKENTFFDGGAYVHEVENEKKE